MIKITEACIKGNSSSKRLKGEVYLSNRRHVEIIRRYLRIKYKANHIYFRIDSY